MKFLRFLCIALCLISLYACKGDEQYMYTEISDEQCSLQYVQSKCDYNDLIKAVNQKPTIEELSKQVHIDCVKVVENGYTVLLDTNEGYVLLHFKSDRVHSDTERIYLSDASVENQISNVAIGTDVYTVQQIDPHGAYPFFYTGIAQPQKVSSHYFESGAYYKVYYNEQYEVIKVEKKII